LVKSFVPIMTGAHCTCSVAYNEWVGFNPGHDG